MKQDKGDSPQDHQIFGKSKITLHVFINLFSRLSLVTDIKYSIHYKKYFIYSGQKNKNGYKNYFFSYIICDEKVSHKFMRV